jgi:hypothetical protein
MAPTRINPDHAMTGAERLRRFRLRRKGLLPPVPPRPPRVRPAWEDMAMTADQIMRLCRPDEARKP